MNFLLIAISFMAFSCNRPGKVYPAAGSVGDSVIVPRLTYAQRAKALYDTVVELYSIPGTALFTENFPRQAGDPATAYFWSHTGMFTAAILLQSLGFKDSTFQKCTDGMAEYWDSSRQPPGYQSAPVQYGKADRFYDDNATAGLDLVEAYQVTGRREFLHEAEACLSFDLSGESPDQGGGLFWNEEVKNNINDPNCIKATNATAFAATLALKLYQITGQQSYLDFAMRLYNWNKAHMQDPADQLYWNDVALKDGAVNKTKWTYNTGEVITNACLFFKITGDSSYLKEAEQLAESAYHYFTGQVGNKGLFFPSHDPWFTAILFRGYLDLYGLDRNPFYVNAVIKNVDYAWQHAAYSKGLFMEDWAGQIPGKYYWILTQAALMEIYARIAALEK